jgi:preprotein translocase subunit SecY
MKRLIEILKTIYRIEDLRNKILITLGFIVVYRFGAHVVLPGLDPMQLGNLQKQSSQGLMSLLNMFSGGAFANASVFALGIMPYISASIVVQLLGMAVPYFQKLQKEGESGRNKLNQITRYLTILILIFQAPAYLANLHYQLPPQAFVVSGVWFTISSVIILTTGTIFVMWLGERITDKGIGNGISLLIMIGIIARLPSAFSYEFFARLESQGGGMIAFLIELIVLFVVFIFAIALIQAVRQVPVQYAKRVIGNKQYGGARQYLPLKLNAAGVMPIIFAQALMFIPLMLAGFKSNTLSGIGAAFSDITGFWYNFTYAIMIILFTYFYTAVIINPTQMAEDLRKNGGFILGVKPGRKTVEYLDSVMSKITLPGSILLAIIAILPAFAMLAGVNRSFAYFFGGTSLLILVGVILDTLQQIETHMMMRHYEGFTKGGRLKGRAGIGAAI